MHTWYQFSVFFSWCCVYSTVCVLFYCIITIFIKAFSPAVQKFVGEMMLRDRPINLEPSRPTPTFARPVPSHNSGLQFIAEILRIISIFLYKPPVSMPAPLTTIDDWHRDHAKEMYVPPKNKPAPLAHAQLPQVRRDHRPLGLVFRILAAVW